VIRLSARRKSRITEGEINQRAFSSDGYIIDQRFLDNLPYGVKQSNDNGCGWIAAYNFLRACGRNKNWDTVRRQLEDSLFLGGFLGTHLLQLYGYLRRHGFSLHWAVGRRSVIRQSACCRVGILFYCNGAALHFVTFRPADTAEAAQHGVVHKACNGVPLYRFWNGRMGYAWDYDTLAGFLDSQSKTPLLLALTTK